MKAEEDSHDYWFMMLHQYIVTILAFKSNNKIRLGSKID